MLWPCMSVCLCVCFCHNLVFYYYYYLNISSGDWSIFKLNATHPPDHSHLCPLKCHLIFFLTRRNSGNIEQAIIPICETNMADKKFVGKLFSASPFWVFGFTIETSTLEYTGWANKNGTRPNFYDNFGKCT